jgi:hypothetical protein
MLEPSLASPSHDCQMSQLVRVEARAPSSSAVRAREPLTALRRLGRCAMPSCSIVRTAPSRSWRTAGRLKTGSRRRIESRYTGFGPIPA